MWREMTLDLLYYAVNSPDFDKNTSIDYQYNSVAFIHGHAFSPRVIVINAKRSSTDKQRFCWNCCLNEGF